MDRVATAPELGLGRPLDVLLVDAHPGTTPGLHDVLGADAEIRRVDDGAVEVVVAVRRRVGLAVEPDLLGPDPHVDVRAAIHQGGLGPDRGPIAQPDRAERAVGTFARATEEVARAEEAGDEPRRRAL